MTDGAGHKLGEVLRTAREAKGVDLNRVERDTKIRSRYLAALETGEYRDLPGAVYTKGFLRNYGVYLGLDPEYLIDLYRLETTVRGSERPTLASPPRPMAVRGQRSFVITQSTVRPCCSPCSCSRSSPTSAGSSSSSPARRSSSSSTRPDRWRRMTAPATRCEACRHPARASP